MRILPLDTLCQRELRVFDVEPLLRQRQEGESFDLLKEPKTQDTLLLFTACQGHYREGDGTLCDAMPGDIVYIPNGSAYTVTFDHITDPAAREIRITFRMEDETGEPFVLSEHIMLFRELRTAAMEELFARMAALYASPARPRLPVQSLLMELLVQLSTANHRALLRENEFSVIRRGIHYLENDPEQTLSVEQIAGLCGVSAGYFRAAFRRYSGQSPSAYRIARKLERARRMLASGEMTATEVADALGFTSLSYFSRCFRAHTGVSPTQYRKG